MAADAPIYVLNLGTQSVTLAEFARGKDGSLILKRHQRQEVLADPAADAARLPQIRLAVAELRDAFKLKPGTPLNYALSGQLLFTRFVKVPAVAPEKIEEMVGFEAQQNVPFPIEEVVWDYQLASGEQAAGASEQMEVALVAVKADALEELNECVTDAGLRPEKVDAGPMALYNAFRFNHGVRAECDLVVDIGARNTNLIFIEGRRLFVRSVPFGGSKVTEALAKEFGESFVAAESRKKLSAYVGLGGAYAEDKDPEVAKAAKVSRNAMTRLHSEVVRNINSYRAQQGGSAPNRIFLAGGGASLGCTREFFSEKFSLPIEFFNPLLNVAVSSSANLEAVSHEAHLLGETVGLALRSMHHCPVELDLPPASIVAAQKDAKRQPAILLAAACFVLALVGAWFLLFRSAAVKEAALEQLNGRVKQMQDYEAAMKRTRDGVADLQKREASMLATAQDREFWVRVMSELNARLPENFIWVTLMEPTQGGRPLFASTAGPGAPAATPPPAAPTTPGRKSDAPSGPVIDGIRLRGLYLDNPSQDRVIVEYVQNLSKSPLFDLDLNNQAAIITKKSPQNATEWAFDYELQLKLKKPLALP